MTAIDFQDETSIDNVDYDRTNGMSGTRVELLALVADDANYIQSNDRLNLQTGSFTVQPDDGGGNQTVTRQLQDVAGYRLLSAPVQGYTVADLAELNLVQGVPAGAANPGQYPTAEDNVFPIYDPVTADANDDTYLGPPNTDYVLAPGEGFFWYLYDNDEMPNPNSFGGGTSRSYDLAGRPLSATGPVNEGSVAVTLENNANGFYMVGNPFAEAFAVNATSFTYAGDGALQNNLQTYDPVNGFQVVSIAAGGTLQVWEGAFAEVDGGTTAATFTYTASTTAPAALVAPVRLALALGGQLATGTAVRDLAAIVDFSDAGTPTWDVADATKLVPQSAEFALLAPVGVRDGTDYRQAVLSVGAVPQGTLDVPMAFQTTTAGTFTITPEGLDAMPSGTVAILVDHVDRTSRTLAEGQPVTFDADAGDWSKRFTLQLALASTDGETGPVAVAVGLVRPNPSAGGARLAVTVAAPERVTATVFDALGRQVAVAFDGEVAPGPGADVSLPSGLAPGVYVVRVQGVTFAESRQMVVTR